MVVIGIYGLCLSIHLHIIASDSAIKLHSGLGVAGHIYKMSYSRQIANRRIGADIHIAQSVDGRALPNLDLGGGSIFIAGHTQKFRTRITTGGAGSQLDTTITLEGSIIRLIGVSDNDIAIAIYGSGQATIGDNVAGLLSDLRSIDSIGKHYARLQGRRNGSASGLSYIDIGSAQINACGSVDLPMNIYFSILIQLPIIGSDGCRCSVRIKGTQGVFEGFARGNHG